MTTLILIVLAIISTILTLWLVVIPAGVLVGSFTALRHGDRSGWRQHFHPPTE